MIAFGLNRLNPRWITSVRITQTPHHDYQVRVRTLDGREYIETYDSILAAEHILNIVLIAMKENA